MAGVEIVAAVVGGAGGLDSEVSDLFNGEDDEFEMRVRHSPSACGPCLGNDNVALVPFPGCNGNIDAIDPDEGIGNLCRCDVIVVKKGDTENHDL